VPSGSTPSRTPSRREASTQRRACSAIPDSWGCLLHFDDDDAPGKSEHIDDPTTIALYR
jgi:hypothetical protein